MLFCLTIVINGLARLMIVATTRKGSKRHEPRSSGASPSTRVMLTLTGVCTVLTVSVLFLILGYLVYNGGKSLDWNFFTKLPLAAGRTGRRHGQRHRRQRARSWDWRRLIGLPMGFLAGIYLSEFEDKTFRLGGALRGRPAQRRALHRDRHLRLDRWWWSP